MSDETVDVGVKPAKRKIKLVEADMTLGMMEEFEDIVGKPLSTVMRKVPVIDVSTGKAVPDPDPEAKGRPLMEVQVSMKAMVALIYLGLREESRAAGQTPMSLEQVRSMKLSEFELDIEADVEDADPLEPNANN